MPPTPYRLRIAWFVLLLICSLGPIGVSAAQEPGESAEAIAQQLQERYNQIHSLSFNFHQRTQGTMAGRPKQGAGNGLFAKTANGPLMRWNYTSPDRQVVTSDGAYVFMYFQQLNQQIISPVDTAQNDMLFSLFSGQTPLARTFIILEPDQEQRDSVDQAVSNKAIQLIPYEENTNIKSILLFIDANRLIRRMVITDHFDTETTINLVNIEVDPFVTLDEAGLRDIFTFTPPEGTEIIRQ